MAISKANQELLEEYEYFIGEKKRSNTVKTYVSDVRSFMEYLGESSVFNAKFRDANEWLKSLTGRNGNKIKANTRNTKIASLNSFYGYFEKNGLCITVVNPFADVDMETIINKGEYKNQATKEVLTNDEVKRLRAALNKNILNPKVYRRGEAVVRMNALRDRAMIMLMVECGLRINELCNLEHEEITMSTRTDSEGNYLGVIAIPVEKDKNKKGRKIPVPVSIMKYINEYLDSVAFTKDEGYVFLSQNGKKMLPNMVNKILKAHIEEAKIDKSISAHSLRHTCITNLVTRAKKHEITIAQIALMVGNSPSMIEKVYLHQTEDSFEGIF